jgi:hypothetical protein
LPFASHVHVELSTIESPHYPIKHFHISVRTKNINSFHHGRSVQGFELPAIQGAHQLLSVREIGFQPPAWLMHCLTLAREKVTSLSSGLWRRSRDGGDKTQQAGGKTLRCCSGIKIHCANPLLTTSCRSSTTSWLPTVPTLHSQTIDFLSMTSQNASFHHAHTRAHHRTDSLLLQDLNAWLCR